jgi:hypothetical protein
MTMTMTMMMLLMMKPLRRQSWQVPLMPFKP